MELFMEKNDELLLYSKTLRKCLDEINKKHLNCSEVPEEFRKDTRVIRALRKNKYRKTISSGYDIIKGRFYVEEYWLERSGDDDIKTWHITYLDSFKEYFEFLEGNICENSCFYQCDLSRDSIEIDIDEERLNTESLTAKKLSDYDFNALLLEKRSKDVELKKEYKKDYSLLKKWKERFFNCETSDELKLLQDKYKKSKCTIPYYFYLYLLIQEDREKAFRLIMPLINASECYYMLEFIFAIEYETERLLENYKPEETLSRSTAVRHSKKFKRLVNFFSADQKITYRDYNKLSEDEKEKLQNGIKILITDWPTWEESGYDIKTGYYKIEVCEMLCVDGKIERLFHPAEYRFYYCETFEEFTTYLCGNLCGSNLEDAPLRNTDFSIYETNNKTVLPKSDNDFVSKIVTYKGYDAGGDMFVVHKKWLNSDKEVIVSVEEKFVHFFDFAYYLSYDLSGADLSNCEGLINVNFDGYKTDGIIAHSKVLEQLGVNYKRIDLEKPIEFTQSKENELTNATGYGVHLVEEDFDYEFMHDNACYYYISDLHLIHRLINEDCKTEIDAKQCIRKLVGQFEGKYGILLIGGDTSSNVELFSFFVSELSKVSSFRKILFVLGNHELWEFKNKSLEDVISTYKNIISQYPDMYLVQNELVYFEEEELSEKMHVISEEEILSTDSTELKKKLISSSKIILGGIGFSGKNGEFNAENGIYRGVITREKEIEESEKFNALYERIKKVVPNRNVIIFSHMPKVDWADDSMFHPGYIYVSGHTHKNTYYDDGAIKVYADNQIGYDSKNIQLKGFYYSSEYDIFEEYEDGIHQISKEDYISFIRGKNIMMTFERNVEHLYMLKKNGYYLFVQRGNYQNKGDNYYILHGGSIKKLPDISLEELHEQMDNVIMLLNGPLAVYKNFQNQISETIKMFGGDGRIHGCIVDIDYWNHIYVNPIDMHITSYWASDMVNKKVYKDISKLLEEHCPRLYVNYLQMIEENEKTNELITTNTYKSSEAQMYFDTDIYSMSKAISKLQRLEKNILTEWVTLDENEKVDYHGHAQRRIGK